MIEIFCSIVFGFLVIRFLVTLYNFVTKPVLPFSISIFPDLVRSESYQQKLISILIPARNEQKNIYNLLSNLLEIDELQQFDYEIIVLNDYSTDNTAQVVADFISKNNTIKLLNGKELPSKWLGKNWACHQLAEIARGKYLLFLDADVRLKNGVISNAIIRMNKYRLNMLSLFPEQEMKTFGEKQIVPLMHFLLLNLLPLRLVRTVSYPSLSAANGQFIMFESAIYNKYLFHEKAKDNILDDVGIFRYAKEQGLKTEVLLGNNQVVCRMYSSGKEAFNGFSKNLFLGFGKNPIGFQIYFLLIFWLWLPFWMITDYKLAIASVVMILIQRVFISLLSNQNVVNNLIFHPLQMFIYTFIGLNSMYIHLTNRVEWKGRKI